MANGLKFLREGESGPRGERGPKGDHGQEGHAGDPGKTGAKGERGRPSRMSVIGYLILLGGVIAALLLTEHHNNQAFAAIEESRKERVEVLNRINAHQCEEIENLKRQLREDAIDSYERLDETLRLLGVKRTPQIEARAKADRDKVLMRFNPGSCPRQILR